MFGNLFQLFLMIGLFSVAACNSASANDSVANSDKTEIVHCVIQVGGKTYTNGPCTIRRSSDMTGKPTFIALGEGRNDKYLVHLHLNNEPSGWSAGEPRVRTPLGILKQNGNCWENERASICISALDNAAASFSTSKNNEAAAAFNARGDAYNGKGQFDQAIKEFNQAIKLAPNFAEAFSGRGMAYKGKGQFDQAINEFDHAIKLNPKIAEGFSGRGDAYVAKGQIDRGIQDYDQAIKLNPSVHFALPNRGIAYA
jgi:tetratricopeptide (TPR) repeat protein